MPSECLSVHVGMLGMYITVAGAAVQSINEVPNFPFTHSTRMICTSAY